MRYSRIPALLLSGFLAVVANGPDAVPVKLKKDDVGDKTKQVVEEETNTAMATEVNGKKENKIERKTAKFAFTEEVLEKPAGAKKPTKLTRLYELAEATTDGVKRTLSFQGK